MDHRATHHDGRLFLTFSLAVLAGGSAAALARVFEGAAPAARLVLAAGAAVAVGALLERRHVALSLTASLLGLLVMLGWVLFPRTLTFGLPTAETVQAVVRALGRVGQHAVEQKAPAQALPSLFSAALIGAWSAAYAAHLLAARAGSAVLALIPPAALLGFAGIILERPPEPAYAGAFLLPAIAVLYASGIRGLRLWGPVLPTRRRSALLAGGPVGRRARTIGVVAVVGALVLPGLLPGFGASALFDLDGGGDRVAISPLVDIRPSLRRTEPVELFTVRANRPSYWRLFAVDRFTGRLWVSTEEEGIQGSTTIEGGATLPRPPGGGGGFLLRQEFALTGLGGDQLPAALSPVAVEVGETVRFDPVRATLTAPEGLPSDGLEYSVTSELVVPAAEELDRPFDLSGVPERYLQLPEDLPPAVVRLAREVTAGARSPYRKALAIQGYLRTFQYDEEFPAGHGTDDLLHFLEQRRGYCEQFSATMAVFLRALGFPARVAVGFTPGTRDATGVYRVTTEEAHAWAEMYFPGYGWLPFEPTPSRANPVAAPYLSLPASGSGSLPTQGPDAEREFGGSLRGPSGQLANAERRLTPVRGFDPGPADEPESRRGWWVIGLGAMAAAALLLGAIPAVKAIRRRRLLRRARAPDERVLAAFTLFEERAADVGLGRREEETLAEYAARLRASVQPFDGHLDRLTGLAAKTLYSGRVPDREDASRALADARSLRVDVRRHVGRGRALVGALRPFRPDDPISG